MSAATEIRGIKARDVATSARRLGSTGRSAGRTVLDEVRLRRAFAHIESYCFFIGYRRSGSTLLGAMLNAHPEMVISNELDALYLFKLELSRTTIFSQIMKQEQRFAKRGYKWTGYDYTVPGQYQGRFERLRVIGDKKAGLSTRRLETKPELLDMVRRKSGVPIRVVHVVRNPFDNIATMARRQNQKLVEVDDLGPQIEGYGTIGTAADDIRARLNPDELIDIRYESFLHSPGPTLVELCKFLGVDASPDYVEACASVAGSASRARDRVQWSDAERHAVEELIAARPILAGYDFEH